LSQYSVNINNFSNQNGFHIYPNPSSGTVTIIYSSTVNKNQMVAVYNILGEVVYSEIWNNSIRQKTIDLSHLRRGLYLICIGDETRKLILG